LYHNHNKKTYVVKLKSSLQKFYGRHHDWLTVTEYQSLKWQRVCSVCRNYNPVPFSFMTFPLVCNTSNTTGATSGARKGTNGQTTIYKTLHST